MKANMSLGDRIDRFGGKLVYRFAGLAVSIMALGFGSGLWWAVKAGDVTAMIVFAPLLIGAGSLVRWCFSPARRLSELED